MANGVSGMAALLRVVRRGGGCVAGDVGVVMAKYAGGLTVEKAIAALDAIDESDCEMAHSQADDILRAMVPPEVEDAYERVIARCRWWACA